MIRFLILFLLWCGIASADINVVYKESTGEIYSVSDRDDSVIPAGYEKAVIKGSASDLPADMSVYLFQGKKLKLNTAKINEREQAAKIEAEKADEMAQIRKQAQKDAFEKLKSNGVVFKHVKDTDF